MRIVAEVIGMLILLPSAGYGIYRLILRMMAKPRVIVVHDSKPNNNQGS